MVTDSAHHQKLAALSYVLISMMMGVVMLGGILLGMVKTAAVEPSMALLFVLAGLAVVELVAWLALRPALFRRFRTEYRSFRENSAATVPGGFWLPRYFIITLLPAALAEGLAIFGVIVAFLTGNYLALIASGAGLVAMVMVFPTQDRYESFARNMELDANIA